MQYKKVLENIKIWIKTRKQRKADRARYNNFSVADKNLFATWDLYAGMGGAADSGGISV